MFKIEKPKEITWPVAVSVPRDGGNVSKQIFTGKFKVITSAEFNAIYAGGGNDEDLVRAVLKGWGEDLCDEAGNPLQFSTENLDLIISVPYIRAAIVQSYLDLSSGRKHQQKN